MHIPTVHPMASSSHTGPKPPTHPELREAFDRFVGTTFYGQMLSSMRKTVGKPAYFHGGRAEEVFTAQLDQQLAEQMTQATRGQVSGAMFELMMLPRS